MKYGEKFDLVYYLCKESSRVLGTYIKHYVAIGFPPKAILAIENEYWQLHGIGPTC